MKIGILGTASSGKTTLVKQLAQHFNLNVVDEIARNYNWNVLDSEEGQYEIFVQQIKSELLTDGDIITDRTVIDNYIYLEKQFKPKHYLLNLVRAWCETYDILILCKKLPFVDDGFRRNIDVEHDMIEFMKNNIIEFHIIDGTISERFLKSVKIIQ